MGALLSDMQTHTSEVVVVTSSLQKSRSMGSTDAAGAILSIVASVISNFGVNIQKLAHTKLEAMEPHLRIPYTRMPMWWLGMGMVVAGAIGDFIALGLASQAPDYTAQLSMPSMVPVQVNSAQAFSLPVPHLLS